MPPNMRILTRGAVAVLGLIVAVSGVTGLVTENPMIALNAAGFIGACALSSVTIFYSVALDRLGLHTARSAATALVKVLTGSAAVMAVAFFVLLSEDRFRDEASTFGFHSVAGVAVLAVLVGVLAIALHDR